MTCEPPTLPPPPLRWAGAWGNLEFLNESPKENSSASAGPWSLGRKCWLLVIQTTNLNSEETETERLEMEQAEETGMREGPFELSELQGHHRDHSNGLFESHLPSPRGERQCYQRITPH